MTNELIHDIEESMRQEKLHALWKDYGPYIIGGAVIAVLLTGAMSGWRAWNGGVNDRETALFVQALSSSDVPAALDGVIADVRPGKKAFAYMTQAGVYLRDGKKAEAAAVYKKAAEDKSLPADFRDLALILDVKTSWTAEQSAAAIERLEPLTRDKNSPWRWNAMIESALIAAHGLKDYAKASALLAPIVDAEDAPPPVRERALALKQVYDLKSPQQQDSAG